MATAIVLQTVLSPVVYSAESVDPGKLKTSKQSVYVDLFDQGLYEEGVQFLRLGDLFRKVTFKKPAAWDINIFEEVPDSAFFTNRHAKKPLSPTELLEGSGGPAPKPGKWTVTHGKVNGINPGFFIKDETGQEFILKFDPIDYSELSTAAEAISSRIFHAIGYYVPTYHVVKFRLDDLQVDPQASYYNEHGFKRLLTKEKVQDLLLFVAKGSDDFYRASASTVFDGTVKGPFDMDGYRKSDPQGQTPHRYLRAVRALRVFASWVNYYDLRSGNTMDVIQSVDGTPALRHYVTDFATTLGSAANDVKPPQFGYEHVFDFGEFFKSVFSFGFWEKPWQKRWNENNRTVETPSMGYFDNRHFDPGKWKSRLPYHAFKDLTASDGYWAAKIIMSFKDEDIEALVKSGQLSDSKVREILVKILVERRNLIGRYWFEKSCPIDQFEISKESNGFKVQGTDLLVHYGLDSAEHRYKYHVLKSNFQREQAGPSIVLDESSLSQFSNPFTLAIQARGLNAKWSKPVYLTLRKEAGTLKLVGIKRGL